MLFACDENTFFDIYEMIKYVGARVTKNILPARAL